MMTALTYGLYAGAVAIAVTLLEYFTGLDKSTGIGLLGWLVDTVCLGFFVYLASKERKEDDFDGVMTYGQGVGTGALVGTFCGCLVAIFMLIYINYINVGFVDMVVQRQEEAFRASKKMTDDEIKKMLVQVRMWAGPWTIVAVLLMNALFGTLLALITSIFVRTKDDEGDVVRAV